MSSISPEVPPEKVPTRLKMLQICFQDARDDPKLIHNAYDIFTMASRQPPDAPEMPVMLPDAAKMFP